MVYRFVQNDLIVYKYLLGKSKACMQVEAMCYSNFTTVTGCCWQCAQVLAGYCCHATWHINIEFI